MGDGNRPHAGERRLRSRLGRTEQVLDPEAAGTLGDSKNAADAAQPAVERELADRRVAAQLRLRDLP